MLKVLIVEDEPGICALIKSIIKWESLDLEFVGYASSAMSAIDIFVQTTPDIVISDIAMPQMTGLEMIHKIRELGYPTKFIIISGYSNFKFAQQAIHDHVDSYLLKPISSTELNCSLKRIVSDLQKQQDKQNTDQYKQRQSFLSNLMANISTNYKTIDHVNEEFHYNFKAGIFSAGIVHFDINSPNNTNNQNIFFSNIVSNLSDTLSPYTFDLEISEHAHCIIFIINFPISEINAVKSAFSQNINNMLNQKMLGQEFSMTIGLGKFVDSIMNIQLSVTTAMDAITSRIILGINRVIFSDEFDYSRIPSKRLISDSENKELSNILDTFDINNFKSFIRNQVEYDLNTAILYPYKIFDFVNETLHSILAKIAVEGLVNQSIVDCSSKIISMLEVCSNSEMLKDVLCDELITLIQPNKGDSLDCTRLIKTALDYINMNYSGKLMLEDVASKVYITPHYFGILFKNTIGTSFSNYLINLRMNEAKVLLNDIKYNVSEISRMVGYSDSKYFGRLFKERIGVSPKEYRKLHHRRY